MKRIAKITVALLLAVAMCFSLAGCYDEDLNWSAKYDDTELPAGAYIYYLFFRKIISELTDVPAAVLKAVSGKRTAPSSSPREAR